LKTDTLLQPDKQTPIKQAAGIREAVEVKKKE
jgi:hypothetical protein